MQNISSLASLPFLELYFLRHVNDGLKLIPKGVVSLNIRSMVV